jgi:hypothetical protein
MNPPIPRGAGEAGAARAASRVDAEVMQRNVVNAIPTIHNAPMHLGCKRTPLPILIST